VSDNLFKLDGRTAVITGGGGILGGAMGLALAGRGAAVAFLDVKDDAAKTAAGRVRALGGKAVGVAANVLDERTLAAAASQVVAEFGRIDILVNAAGGNSPAATTAKESVGRKDLSASPPGAKTFFDLGAADLRSVFDLNVLGTFLASQAFGRAMAERGGGVIVNISSMAAVRPLTKVPAYSAAKAGVSNFTAWLAAHLAPLGIRVNAIAPGFFLTGQNRFLLTDEKTGDLTARGKAIIAHTPMRRFGTGDDLAGTLLWLVSDASSFVTGIVVPVDGGFSAFGGV
jgi:NAD(P)-dependent dehydrogenase (short-subunit alcohol dehydrogenase family)